MSGITPLSTALTEKAIRMSKVEITDAAVKRLQKLLRWERPFADAPNERLSLEFAEDTIRKALKSAFNAEPEIEVTEAMREAGLRTDLVDRKISVQMRGSAVTQLYRAMEAERRKGENVQCIGGVHMRKRDPFVINHRRKDDP